MKRTALFAALTYLFFFNGCGYNQMQQLEEKVFTAWGNLESALQRRADLIPNLVSTVKGYAAHERETLESVQRARSEATGIRLDIKDLGNQQALEKFQQAQGSLSGALSRLLAVSERYPDLKADRHFSDLMNQLEGTENRINVARSRYNETVNEFNYAIRKFPNSLVNSIALKLERKEYFKADEGAKQAPKVEF
ncbi:MAG: LemA family protein [Spirochaetia bacterium]|jgi:LemA protein|nr:LemA family protein [Spirochaetia bacterium]